MTVHSVAPNYLRGAGPAPTMSLMHTHTHTSKYRWRRELYRRLDGWDGNADSYLSLSRARVLLRELTEKLIQDSGRRERRKRAKEEEEEEEEEEDTKEKRGCI